MRALVSLVAAGALGVAANVAWADCPPYGLTPLTPKSGTVLRVFDDRALVVKLRTGGGSGQYFWQYGGTLPPGLKVDFPSRPPGGRILRAGADVQSILGTPTEPGVWPGISVNVYDWPNFPDGVDCPVGASATYTIKVLSFRRWKSLGEDVLDAKSVLYHNGKHPDRHTLMEVRQNFEKALATLEEFARLVGDQDDPALRKTTRDLHHAVDYIDHEPDVREARFRAFLAADSVIHDLNRYADETYP